MAKSIKTFDEDEVALDEVEYNNDELMTSPEEVPIPQDEDLLVDVGGEEVAQGNMTGFGNAGETSLLEEAFAGMEEAED